ncbi:MAG: hypothetical protein WC197_04760 [Candidatus Gastranaerophilaceae bacterium]|jgi:hypothetical protein
MIKIIKVGYKFGMKLEFVTAIKDYNFTGKQKLFAYVLKYKHERDFFCESLKVNYSTYPQKKAIDSLTMWRLAPAGVK